MSMKDLCTIDLLPEILEAGVYSLKLEGRMKQPAYTAGVTSIYRKYLDRLKNDGPESYQVEEEDRSRLKKIFSRGGSCDGYYRRNNGPDMIAFVNEKKTEEVPFSLQPVKRKVTGFLQLKKGEPVRLRVSADDTTVQVEKGEVQEAKTEPLERAQLLSQMDRLGGTAYEWEHLEIRLEEGCFVPMRVLNECRREACEKLTGELLAPYRREGFPKEQRKKKEEVLHPRRYGTGRPGFYVSCETVEQCKAVLAFEEIDGIYVNYDGMQYCMDLGAAKKKELYLALPHVVREKIPEEYLRQAKVWLKEGMKGFLVRNLESFAQLSAEGLAPYCVLDHAMYTWNDRSIEFWDREGILRNTAPLELNAKELAHRDNRNSELLIYGYLPVMLSAQCIRKNCFHCTGPSGRRKTGQKAQDSSMLRLRDRYQASFPVQTVCDPWKTQNTAEGKNCYNIIYNSLPFGLQGDWKEVKKLGMKSLRAAFTLETGRDCQKILEELLQVFLHDGTPREHAYTRGHFKRGAE